MADKEEGAGAPPVEGEVAPETTPGYKAPPKESMQDILNKDSEDESLRKYKESLLGAAAAGATASPADDPRRVVPLELRIIFEGRDGKDVVYPLEKPEDLEKAKTTAFVLKEKCNYKIQVLFRVQHDIVSGLKYCNSVYRKGLRVSTDEIMLGSYGPQAEPHKVLVPRRDWEQAPGGMLYRGNYTAKSMFVDDDGTNHMSYEYGFDLKKDFKD